MTKFTLIDNIKYQLIMSVNEEDFDYYTDICIELIYAEKNFLLFKDNLLALKNIIERYDKEVYGLDTALNEKFLGMLLNEYYRCLYEDQLHELIVLDKHGQWIGERYCLLISLNYATWIYKYGGNIILRVTPIFCGFEEDNYSEEYNKFMYNYKDIFKEIVSLQQFRYMKEKILKIFNLNFPHNKMY